MPQRIIYLVGIVLKKSSNLVMITTMTIKFCYQLMFPMYEVNNKQSCKYSQYAYAMKSFAQITLFDIL